MENLKVTYECVDCKHQIQGYTHLVLATCPKCKGSNLRMVLTPAELEAFYTLIGK